jgi:hypothetical protein
MDAGEYFLGTAAPESLLYEAGELFLVEYICHLAQRLSDGVCNDRADAPVIAFVYREWSATDTRFVNSAMSPS